MMNIHEFGKENNEIILLIHPSVVKWDYFENVIPLLQEKYHLLIPALPGYDFENDSDFTSVEQIASELNDWLSTRGYRNLYAVYGCSMGGSVALMVTLEQRIKIEHCIMDGGITPYQLPWLMTRFIVLKDYLMIMLGRAGGISLLEKAFATEILNAGFGCIIVNWDAESGKGMDDAIINKSQFQFSEITKENIENYYCPWYANLEKG